MPYAVRLAVLAEAEAIARVHVDTWSSAYTGIIPAAYMEARTFERRVEMWREALARTDWWVFVAAADEPGVVGFAAAGPARETERPDDVSADGEVYALYVLAGHQRRGVGARLLSTAFDALGARGFEGAFLWVLERNSARGFYEAMGGLEVGSRNTRFGEVALAERAYAWNLSD